jgi:sarcosine oxidase subunit alpha
MYEAAQPYRLVGLGHVDRSRTLSFRFDGKPYQGYSGDSLASALLASGVRVVGRSFKYHRPRGILTAGPEEPNALVELRSGARREANTPATMIELFDGLEAWSQNRWPSLAFDLGAINSLLSPLLVAGFYYKTFMWPAALWEKLYEPAIRRMAGLGRASGAPDPDTYEKIHAFCDVLIVGAGPAGLAATVSAARCGARVILCDEDFLPGGRLNSEYREIDGIASAKWARQIEAELLGMPEVRILRRTTVFGAYDAGDLSSGRTFGALERVCDHLPLPPAHQPRQRLWRIVAKRTIVATGAIERPIVFDGNDRPGVMLASALRSYLNRFGVTAGRRVAVFTTTDDGWRTASNLFNAGVAVVAIIDARADITPPQLDHAKRIGAQLFLGSHVVRAYGSRSLSHVVVRDSTGREIRLAVDVLGVSGGWNPSLALSTHLGGRPRWSDEISAFVPHGAPRGMTVVGAAAGSFSLAECLREGADAGVLAAAALNLKSVSPPRWRTDDELVGIRPLWRIPGSNTKAFVDFQHDVTSEDITLAVREGFTSVELLKRYTTLGMATDQGKTSAINGHGILAALTNQPISAVGTTVYRAPSTPVAIGALAGRHRGKSFKPTRLTAGHAWARERGATFVDAGQWLRAQGFPATGDNGWLATVSREASAVRSKVGVCDISTLGKIDVQGPDAAEFLDRIYINKFSTLAIGSARYGVMLREDGFVLDDGVTARFMEHHYLMSTSTANAARVLQHLEHARQVLWPELDVQIFPVTEQWSQYAIAGPRSRELLQQLFTHEADISNAAFPHLACARFVWRGISARLFRVSFSGELGFELAVPARYGDATIRAIIEAGAPLEVTPYGLEAMDVLRIEKGHVTGNEINGTTTAADLGFGGMISKQKDCLGRLLASRPALVDPQRPALVGIKPLDKSARIHVGAHFLASRAAVSLENDEGYLTSAGYSPLIGQWIALGLLRRGRERIGERIRVYDPLRGHDIPAEIVSPAFFDPRGARLRM